MPPRHADVVSPELALVDPVLAGLARAALPACSAPSRRVVRERAAVAAASRPEARRRVVTPALTLLATAVASLVVTVVTDSEQASGQVTVTASPAPAAIRAAAVTDGKAISGRAASRLSNAPPVYETESSSGLGAVREHGAEAGPPRVLVETPPGSPPALGPAGHKTLVWSRASDATSYDVELVRDATVIFASRSASARLVLPVSWMWNGVRYAVQPEDQAFVWPVVDGRRAATPVVDGMLVLETTLVARLIAEGQSPANP